jgi:hypothetical protein
MKFEIILNMPVRPKANTSVKANEPNRDGALVHRIVCEHPADNVGALMAKAADDGYVVVDEYYPDNSRLYTNHGPIALSYTVIGKVKFWDGK